MLLLRYLAVGVGATAPIVTTDDTPPAKLCPRCANSVGRRMLLVGMATHAFAICEGCHMTELIQPSFRFFNPSARALNPVGRRRAVGVPPSRSPDSVKERSNEHARQDLGQVRPPRERP